MNNKDKETLQRVNQAMQDLVNYFEGQGQFFVFTCAFKKSHDYDSEQTLLTLADFTSTFDVNVYEEKNKKNRDLTNKLINSYGNPKNANR